MFYLENGMLNKDHSIHLLTKYSPQTYLPDIINCILIMLNETTRPNLNKSKTILWYPSVLSSHGSAQLSLFSVQLWSSAGTTFFCLPNIAFVALLTGLESVWQEP